MVNRTENASLIFKIFIVTLMAQIQLVLSKNSLNTRDFVPGTDADITITTTDDYPMYDSSTDMPRLGTDICNEKAACSLGPELSFPSKSCYCDNRCSILGDCCANYDLKSSSSLTKDQFSCVEMPEIVKNLQFGVNLVTKCAPDWNDGQTKQLCENISNTDDIFLKLPVSEPTEDAIMYRNMYCAQCNYVFDYKFWKLEMKCQDELCESSQAEIKDCGWINFIQPNNTLGYRLCQLRPKIVESCPNKISGDETSKRCTDSLYSIVYDKTQVYKNKFCALCYGILEENLFCKQIPWDISPEQNTTICPRSEYSFKKLVNLETGTISKNDVNIERRCKDNEIFGGSSVKDFKCREVYCPPSRQAYEGKCIIHTAAASQNGSHNDSAEKFIRKDTQSTMFQFENLEVYFTLACLTISITSLAITLLIYICFPQLRNTPGKLLICLIICLLLGQTLFIISSKFEHISALCKIVAVAVHFCFLAAFCWMNIIALDLWMTFSNRFVTPGSSTKETKRFAMYSVYAWLTPFIIVTISVVLDCVDIDPTFSDIKPQYGDRICWITSRHSLILFFVGPLALFKLFDITAFIFTVVHIARAKREGAMASNKKNTCSFLINLKLSFIMGLTWVFGLVANVSKETVMWYMFIIFNGLQGFFIALCFSCTRKVRRLLRDKYKQMFSSGTQETSAQGYKAEHGNQSQISSI